MKSLGLGIILLLVGLLVNSTFNFVTKGNMDPQILTESFAGTLAFSDGVSTDSSVIIEELPSELAVLRQGAEAAAADFQEGPLQTAKH